MYLKLLVTKQLAVAIDFHSIFIQSVATTNSSVTKILQNIFWNPYRWVNYDKFIFLDELSI